MSEFNKLKDNTQNEIAELILTDKYIKKDLSKFSNLKDKTQKEIAELKLSYDSESAEETIKEFVFENKFDFFRLMKITEFNAEQARKQKEILNNLNKEEKAEFKREFTNPENIADALGLRKAEGFHAKDFKLSSSNHPELNNRDLIKTIKENEQKYLSAKAESEIKLLKNIATLGYRIKLY